MTENEVLGLFELPRNDYVGRFFMMVSGGPMYEAKDGTAYTIPESETVEDARRINKESKKAEKDLFQDRYNDHVWEPVEGAIY
jgi:hypothetical protein